MFKEWPVNILLIEENPDIQNRIRESFSSQKRKFEITIKQSIKESKLYLSKNKPDFIISRLLFKESSSFELLEINPNHLNSPMAIYHTTYDDKIEDEVRRAGALDYIVLTNASINAMPQIVTRLFQIWKLLEQQKIEEQKRIKINKELVDTNLRLKQTQASLIQQEKLASLGQLAAGIAHELNNPLGFIGSNFNALKKYFDRLKQFFHFLDEIDNHSNSGEKIELIHIKNKIKEQKIDFILEDFQAVFSESQEGINRMRAIVDNLRSFSRVDDEGRISELDLNDAIQKTLVVARNEIKQVAVIKKKLNTIPPMKCKADEINQVLLNLIVNAAQAIKSQNRNDMGEIFIETFHKDNYIHCYISDDGPGIPPENLKKIFDPFFTTKDVGEGTGLGLNISYDIIVKKHKGELKALSKLGHGATFLIKLPIQ